MAARQVFFPAAPAKPPERKAAPASLATGIKYAFDPVVAAGTGLRFQVGTAQELIHGVG